MYMDYMCMYPFAFNTGFQQTVKETTTDRPPISSDLLGVNRSLFEFPLILLFN